MNWMKVTVFGMLGLALCVTDAGAATCETLRTFSIKLGTIASAQLVPHGPYVPAPRAGGGARAGAPAQPGAGAGQPAARAGGPPPAPVMLPEHCRVKMVLKPSSDSNINAELWLPTTTWNGKFMAVGNGGFGGSIQGYGEMANALALGYA